MANETMTLISRDSSAAVAARASASRWANTAAITSILVTTYGGTNYQAGTTMSLFGVAA